jgi:hypothetical protein
MVFAKWLFLAAGGLGILVVAPPYFLERWSGEFDPPPVNHPEYYYGFLGVTLAWQFMYLLIASDPVRFRPVMLLGAVGKTSFVVAVIALYAAGRVSPLWLGFAAFDVTLVALFVAAYLQLPRLRPPADR